MNYYFIKNNKNNIYIYCENESAIIRVENNFILNLLGEMAEWFKAIVWKTIVLKSK